MYYRCNYVYKHLPYMFGQQAICLLCSYAKDNSAVVRDASSFYKS